MTREIDDQSRDILSFRPTIDFVEPAQEEQEILGRDDSPQEVEELDARNTRIKNLAKAVETLSAAVQAKVDRKAKDVVMRLDPIVDKQVIDAIKRQCPEVDDSGTIPYSCYKKCKEIICAKGLEAAEKGTTSDEEISAAREEILAGSAKIGGLGTEEAVTGGLRPELYIKNQLIEPFNVPEFQNYLIRVLVNFIWKNFIKKAIPLPPGVPELPEQLAKVPPEFELQLSGIADLGVDVLGG